MFISGLYEFVNNDKEDFPGWCFDWTGPIISDPSGYPSEFYQDNIDFEVVKISQYKKRGNLCVPFYRRDGGRGD